MEKKQSIVTATTVNGSGQIMNWKWPQRICAVKYVVDRILISPGGSFVPTRRCQP